ncbi:hypothetical protein JYK22_21465, partial [Nonomuraea sp. RK-328]|nr:hypothetical protein [Nonomuraea sp. RK-328]
MEFTITVTGTQPLLVHNSRLANPLDPIVKEIKKLTSKRKKTDDDHAEVARLEFHGSLYLDSDIGPYIPGENFQRCLLDAARVNKLGKSLERAVFIDTDVNPIAYAGPRTADGLWADENFRHMKSVKVGMQRVMRCRPIFQQWKCQAHGLLDTSLLDLAELRTIAENAGSMIGLGDWRPRFGRFQAVIEEA